MVCVVGCHHESVRQKTNSLESNTSKNILFQSWECLRSNSIQINVYILIFTTKNEENQRRLAAGEEKTPTAQRCELSLTSRMFNVAPHTGNLTKVCYIIKHLSNNLIRFLKNLKKITFIPYNASFSCRCHAVLPTITCTSRTAFAAAASFFNQARGMLRKEVLDG